MKITLERNPVEHVAAAALIVPVFEREKESRFGAAPFVESGEVAGKADEFTLLHNPTGAAAARVLLAGGGKAGRFDAAGLR
ncbi:MAG: M17 family peptidase N-terminal domain-containing protein, partial [Bryobacteraceae bacterium]